ncbi:MAG: hypothetical protein HRU20_18175 [Pseudomonadales bacterium]|nr:hypothetical protein [Pseudomonadales bacterium]
MFFNKPFSMILKMLLLLALITVYSTASQAELVIIVHPDNPNISLSKSTVKKIFLRRIKGFPDGSAAKPVVLKEGELRREFVKTVLRKNESSLSSYWSRLLFSGKATPPMAFKTQEALMRYVALHTNAIGYVDSTLVNDYVKTVILQ